jgi:hypothetical protein
MKREVRMTTAIATPIAFEWYPFNTPDLSGREIQASQSLRLAAVSEVSKDITLRTREGDTVTLSMDRETVAVYGRDARMAIDQQYAVTADGDHFAHDHVAAETREWFGFEASQEISVTVEGDLSREEMRDIRKALHRIDRLIGKSFGPQTAGRQGHGSAGLSGLDTLAGIEVDVRQSRTILAAQSSSIATLSYGPDGQAAESLVHPEEPVVPAWQAVADEATAIVEETGIAPERFVDPLRDLFGHWAREMKHRRSPFHPMLKMMEARVMGRLPSWEGNGLHQA